MSLPYLPLVGGTYIKVTQHSLQAYFVIQFFVGSAIVCWPGEKRRQKECMVIVGRKMTRWTDTWGCSLNIINLTIEAFVLHSGLQVEKKKPVSFGTRSVTASVDPTHLGNCGLPMKISAVSALTHWWRIVNDIYTKTLISAASLAQIPFSDKSSRRIQIKLINKNFK